MPPRITGAGSPRGRRALAPSQDPTPSGLVGAWASCPNAHIADWPGPDVDPAGIAHANAHRSYRNAYTPSRPFAPL